jgi:hypothetical protein
VVVVGATVVVGGTVVVVGGTVVVVVGGTVVVVGGTVVVGATVVVVGGTVVVVGGTVVVGATVVVVAGATVVVVAAVVDVEAGVDDVVGEGVVVDELDDVVDDDVVEEGTDARPNESPPGTTGPTTGAGAVGVGTAAGTTDPVGVGTAAGTTDAVGAAEGLAIETTGAAEGNRTLGAARRLGAPREASSGAAGPTTTGEGESDAKPGDGENDAMSGEGESEAASGVRPMSPPDVVGVATVAGSAAKPGAVRRDPAGACSISSRPSATTAADGSASAVPRGWFPPTRPSVTAATHAAVATAALPTAKRRRRPRGT